ncbi:MAG: hypothetical protein QNK23_10205 [Crocinitomicaceae bacterium]|nr:hypothetical protein [Crocinitomicaceae bacterium]
MRTVILVLMTLTLSYASAHEYFFSFAELEYNDVSQKFEATLTLTTHDLERAMNADMDESIVLDDSQDHYELVESYLNRHFRIVTGKSESYFAIIGHEISLNGTVNFYLESAPIDLEETISFTFDLLMDKFSNQQNKITFYHRDRTYTRPFVGTDRTRTINLETELK